MLSMAKDDVLAQPLAKIDFVAEATNPGALEE